MKRDDFDAHFESAHRAAKIAAVTYGVVVLAVLGGIAWVVYRVTVHFT